jgi:glutathione S-transferase
VLTIYHVTNTRGTRVIWLCEELGLDYEVVKIDFSAAYRATDEWRALNPVGKVPVLRDGDMIMFESGAMVEYVLARYGQGRLAPSADSPDYAHYLQWLWFGEATLSRPLGEIVNHRREFPGDAEIPAMIEEMKDRTEVCLHALAAHLQGREYLVGDAFSAADIMVGYALLLVEMLAPERMPDALQPYWQGLKQRAALQTAMAA